MIFIFWAIFFGLVGTPSKSHAVEPPICRTIKQCRDLRDEATQRIRELAPKLKRSNKQMTYDEALEFCQKADASLSTARELATWITGHGARGVRETIWRDIPTSDPRVMAENSAAAGQGYQMIIPRARLDGVEVVDFYYSDSGVDLDSILTARFSGVFHTSSMGVDDLNYLFDTTATHATKRFKAHRSPQDIAFAICTVK